MGFPNSQFWPYRLPRSDITAFAVQDELETQESVLLNNSPSSILELQLGLLPRGCSEQDLEQAKPTLQLQVVDPSKFCRLRVLMLNASCIHGRQTNGDCKFYKLLKNAKPNKL